MIKDKPSEEGKRGVIESFGTEELSQETSYVLGIDEAGRGPVLGPMVYGLFICPAAEETQLRTLGIQDSKQLTADVRERLLTQLQSTKGWASFYRALSAREISVSMLQEGVNLNELSYNTVFALLDAAFKVVKRIKGVFVDTVGSAEKYQARLEARYPGIPFTVCSKADSKFPVVGAASIVAKVTRDERLKDHPLPHGISRDFGSGYPADPITKMWLEQHAHPVSGFPDIVRFSWASTVNVLEKKGYGVTFGEKLLTTKNLLASRNPSTTKKVVKGIMRYASLSLK